MCLPNYQMDRRRRRTIAIGNGALAVGLVLWNLVNRTEIHAQPWLQAVCGFLLGISIAVNLSALVMPRKCSGRQDLD